MMKLMGMNPWNTHHIKYLSTNASDFRPILQGHRFTEEDRIIKSKTAWEGHYHDQMIDYLKMIITTSDHQIEIEEFKL